MSGNLTDVLALAEAINARRSSDDRFAELIGEVSTALADIVAAMEKGKQQPMDPDAIGKAIAAALLAGIKAMPQPVIKMDMPAQAGAAPAWKRMEIDLNRDASGRIGNKLTLTRVA